MRSEPAGTVAVIMRTKNRPLLLERAFGSVLSQTYDNWHLVVVNDGGESEPVDRLVHKFEPEFAGRVTVIHNPTSLGMEAASNLGLARSQSTYVVIHDDDDTWAPNFLLMCVNELVLARKTLSSVQGVISYSTRVLERVEHGTVVFEHSEPFNTWLEPGVLSFFRLARSNTFPPISFLYRREVFDTLGGMYRADLPVLGDWEFNLRFMSHFDIFVVPYALAFYHHRVAAGSELGNSVHAGAQKHALYNQALRNELLRLDVQGKAGGLGVVVNLAEQFGCAIDHLESVDNQVSASAHSVERNMFAHPQAKQSAPAWAAAGVLAFLRGRQHLTLVRKFIMHWRRESPQRALAVVLRYGYLAMGGK